MIPFASSPERNLFMLKGALARGGYDWWWHNFTARHATTGEEKAFFIEYFICNPAAGGAQPSFGGAVAGGGAERPAYGLIKVGCWGADARQLHRYFGIEEVEIGQDRLAIQMADCALSETSMTGQCTVTAADAAARPEWASDVGSLRWSLAIDKQLHYSVGYGAGTVARALNLFEMYWHAEGIKTAYSGWVELDGERYEVTPSTCFGYADKELGQQFHLAMAVDLELRSGEHGQRTAP